MGFFNFFKSNKSIDEDIDNKLLHSNAPKVDSRDYDIDHKDDDSILDCSKCKILFIFFILLICMIVLMIKVGSTAGKYNVGYGTSSAAEETKEKIEMDKFLFRFDILEDFRYLE
jgi:hypothetical protein